MLGDIVYVNLFIIFNKFFSWYYYIREKIKVIESKNEKVKYFSLYKI